MLQQWGCNTRECLLANSLNESEQPAYIARQRWLDQSQLCVFSHAMKVEVYANHSFALFITCIRSLSGKLRAARTTKKRWELPLEDRNNQSPIIYADCKKINIRRVFTVCAYHCEERLLRARDSGWSWKNNVFWIQQGSYTYKLATVVTSRRRPGQAQATSSPIMGVSSWRERVSWFSLQLWPQQGSCFSGWPHIQKCMDSTNDLVGFEKRRKGSNVGWVRKGGGFWRSGLG